MKNYQSLKNALNMLGYKGFMKCLPCGYLRDIVLVNDEKIGIWDYQKNTFVD